MIKFLDKIGLMDGDFEAIIRVPFEKGEFAKAFLIGEGFVIKKE